MSKLPSGLIAERIASKRGWVHPQVKEVAIGLAEAMYEKLASRGTPESNLWYRQNKDRAAYVQRTWPLLIPQARATLARILASPAYDVEMKDKIHQALVDDQQFREGRMRGLQKRLRRNLGR